MPTYVMVCQGPGCGKEFEARRATAKYHDKACSVRASRAGQLGEPTVARPGRPKRPVVNVDVHLARYTRSELSAVKRLETSSGQAALVLALRIDAGGAETGSALASMVREHAAAMERALAETVTDDPLAQLQASVAKGRAEDEVARQRERRSASES